jgi:hypothetical protein
VLAISLRLRVLVPRVHCPRRSASFIPIGDTLRAHAGW